MKLNKILISLFVFLSCLLCTSVKADTTAPASFTVGASHSIETEMYLSKNFADGVFVHKQKTTTGDFIYCIDMYKHNVTSGSQVYYLKGELDARYAYVLEHGYPNYLFGNEEKDYFTTALAMWYLSNPEANLFKDFNLEAGTYRGEKSDIVVKMNELIIGANNYSYTKPTISFADSSNELTLSSDGKYYTSGELEIKTTGNIKNESYTLSLSNAPTGTIITDINGKEKSTFAIGEKFIVKVLKANINNTLVSFELTASAEGTVSKAYRYEPADSYYQSVAALYPENEKLSSTMSFKLELKDEPVPVTISKRDVTTGEELPGAHLELMDENGDIIYAWVSTNEPFIITDGLKPGKYILRETIAPDGYELSTETVEFIVKEDGTVDGDVIMYNKPETVEVPSTSSFKTITASLIGIIVIGLGSLIIYKNYKKNEEK